MKKTVKGVPIYICFSPKPLLYIQREGLCSSKTLRLGNEPDIKD